MSDSTETGEDAGPPEETESPRRPIDVLLFAPVGVIMTVLDDLPGLIDKGRRRVEQEIANAHSIGEFVVQVGQSEVTKRVAHLWSNSGRHGVSDGTDDSADVAAEETTVAAPKPTPDPADSSLVEQIFAGYDTLSASQVVRRLESLDPEQLGAVHRYEASHRNRRTILNRTQQLTEQDPPAGSDGSTP